MLDYPSLTTNDLPLTANASPLTANGLPLTAHGLPLTKIIIEETLGIDRINEPVTVGIPFRKEILKDASLLTIQDPDTGVMPLQTETLATWIDNSLKWVLFDFQASVKAGTAKEIEVNIKEKPESIEGQPGIEVKEEPGHFKIDTGAASFWVNKSLFKPFHRVVAGNSEILDGEKSEIILMDDQGNEYEAVINKVYVETSGSIRTALKFEGQFRKEGKSLAAFFARIYFYRNSSIVKMDFTTHNPRAAKHPGGLWDLGDPGSIFFKDLSLHLALNASNSPVRGNFKISEDLVPSPMSNQLSAMSHELPSTGGQPSAVSYEQSCESSSPLTARIHLYDEPSTSGEPISAMSYDLSFKNYELSAMSRELRIYQDSSGGENWKSKNHVNRNGEVKNSFRGYRIYSGEKIIAEGNRANPIISVKDGEKGIAAGVQYFWQNFPKALEINGNSLKVGIFPPYYDDVFELQGGEQKTHSIFMNFNSSSLKATGLEWIQSPLIQHASPEWYAQTNAIPYLIPEKCDSNEEIVELIQSAIDGEKSFFKRREIIDEYGWRNFGELYADHEAVPQNHSSRSPSAVSDELSLERSSCELPAMSRGLSFQPLVSHYNNQYDCINGALMQFMRSGNPKWFVLADQLCRHVKDIDIYHTDEDRPGFNHGLFWHTEHYLDAQTATHRCFSKNHAPYRNLASYGGGPSLSHNYSSGMLLHYYLTGERPSMEVVLELASFVENTLAIENTLSNRLFQKVKRFKNYLKNRFKEKGFVQIEKVYGLDGPGRASGNALNTLLDVLVMTKKDKYLDLAEELLKQCVSPEDNLSQMDLLDSENRWMYTVFLQALGKYLDVAGELPKNSHLWEYARKTLIHYAKWMSENEYLYLEKPEKLEFPNETWAAQDVRKSNVLFNAAKYSEEKLRKLILERAEFLYREAFLQFFKFNTITLTRPIALMMQNSMTYSYWEGYSLDCKHPQITGEDYRPNDDRSVKWRGRFKGESSLMKLSAKAEKEFWKWNIISKIRKNKNIYNN